MRRASSLSLMELAIMTAVFALAAAMCLRVFVWADGRSRENEARSHMAVCAQNIAEMLKYTHGDLAASADALGGSADDNLWMLSYNEKFELTEGAAEYTIEVRKNAGAALLGQADISALDAEGETLLALTVCWQEEYDG